MPAIVVSETSNIPLSEQVQLMLDHSDMIVAYRSHRTGWVLCGDCASIEEATEGADHTVLAFGEDEAGDCDCCGSHKFD